MVFDPAVLKSSRQRRSFRRTWLGAVLVLPCSIAHAGEPSGPDAATLDAEGTALLNQRKFDEACPKLEASFRRQPGTGVLLRLALCQELSGKKASAWASYRDALELARKAGKSDLIQLAEKRAAALEPRLAHLTVHLDPTASNAPALEVSRNGTPIERAALESAILVDPGSQVIEAKAPGRKPFREVVVVGEGPMSYWITITLPSETPQPAARPLPETPPKDPPSSWSTQRSLALAAAGVGVAGLTVGAVFGMRVASRMSRARDLCTNGSSGCSDRALTLQEDARGAALASNIAFGVGAAGVLGGVALWLTAPKAQEQRPNLALRVAPLVGDVRGLQAVGTW